MRALVIGGTGPTGPFIVSGLRRRGYKVTIFHRGTHEIAEIPQEVEHIHGDPHFAETIDAALSGRTFDLAIASYGRVRLLAHALKGRAGRFIALGGFAVYRGWHDPYALTPPGLAIDSMKIALVFGLMARSKVPMSSGSAHTTFQPKFLYE